MSKSCIFFLLALFASSQAHFLDQVIFEEWNEFKLQHRKNYQDQTEELFRLKIFRENKLKIAQHNQRFETGEETFRMAINEYADLMTQEFNELMNGFNYTLQQEMRTSDESLRGATFLPPEHLTLPKAVDWRSTGAVTEVKDQGACGSCWAFSSTGSLEGQHFRKTGKLVSLSEQNLVDCSASYGNGGCYGGFMDLAFQYIKENAGIDTEGSYPYRAADGTCRFQRSTIGATSTGFVDVPRLSELALAQAVASVGPISVAIDASHESFHLYKSGVYQEKECDPQNLVHAVLVVGFGTENGQDFWLVKNSWGTTWGDGGYIKMLRNGNNQCGIASLASYPLV